MNYLILLILLISFVILNTANSYAFRCNMEPVGIYDSASDVLTRCGQPGKKGYKRVNVNGVIKHCETWYYNCGEGDFVYAVIFNDGIVFREEAVQRGSGRSRCGTP